MSEERFKYAFRPVNERAGARAEVLPLLSVSQYRGVVPRTELAGDDGRAADLSNYKTCVSGDIVLNRMSAYNGAVGLAKQAGLVSPDYLVLRPERHVSGPYLAYLIRSHWFIGEMTSRVKGIGSVDSGAVRTPRIGLSELGEIMVDLPEFATQRAIADCLDRETAQIDAFIAKNEELIALLTERRSAAIYDSILLHSEQAGISTGLPWAPRFPEHWEVAPLGSIARELKRANRGLREKNLLSLSYGQIVPKSIDSNDGLVPASFETYQIVEPGALVFRLTDLQNDQRSLRTGLVHERGIITSAYVAIELNRLNPDFADYLFRAIDIAKVFYSMGGGVRQSMAFADLRRLRVPIPPLTEQRRLVDELQENTASTDKAIGAAREAVLLARERRAALISAAVTGKIDVGVSA